MSRLTLAALAGAAALLGACQQKAPETAAPAAAPETAEVANLPAAEGPVGADLPADQMTPEQRAGQERAAAEAGLPPVPQARTAFACENGETIETRFFPEQGIAVLVRGGQNVELDGQPVASGFLYSGGDISIRGKGDELMLTVGSAAPVRCTAAAG